MQLRTAPFVRAPACHEFQSRCYFPESLHPAAHLPDAVGLPFNLTPEIIGLDVGLSCGRSRLLQPPTPTVGRLIFDPGHQLFRRLKVAPAASGFG